MARVSAFPRPVSPAGMKGPGQGRGTALLHPQSGRAACTLPIHLGLRATDSPRPGSGSPLHRAGRALSPGGQELLSRWGHPASPLGAISADRAKARTIRSPAMATPPPPQAGGTPSALKSVQVLCPPPTCAQGCARPAPGRPPSHRGGGESPDSCARRTTPPVPDPHCSRPCRGCHHPHAGAGGSAEPTPAMGARGSRASARGPVGAATARAGRCASSHAARTAPAPGGGGEPLPPDLRRARRAAATSILGSPRPRFTNAASAGRRRRRGGRLRPPGDTASFT